MTSQLFVNYRKWHHKINNSFIPTDPGLSLDVSINKDLIWHGLIWPELWYNILYDLGGASTLVRTKKIKDPHTIKLSMPVEVYEYSFSTQRRAHSCSMLNQGFIDSKGERTCNCNTVVCS